MKFSIILLVVLESVPPLSDWYWWMNRTACIRFVSVVLYTSAVYLDLLAELVFNARGANRNAEE